MVIVHPSHESTMNLHQTNVSARRQETVGFVCNSTRSVLYFISRHLQNTNTGKHRLLVQQHCQESMWVQIPAQGEVRHNDKCSAMFSFPFLKYRSPPFRYLTDTDTPHYAINRPCLRKTYLRKEQTKKKVTVCEHN